MGKGTYILHLYILKSLMFKLFAWFDVFWVVSKTWKISKKYFELVYALSLCFSYFMDVIYLYLKLVLNQIVSWKQWTWRCIGITIEIWLQLLLSTCLYIIEMLEFIAKQRLAPPKSETLSDSHHALVSWIILIGVFTCTC